MKTYSAIEVRKHFGQILDEAAAGERIVIERAGQPVAGLVPMADLEAHDPEARKRRQLAALERMRRLAQRVQREYGPFGKDAATIVREDRDARTAKIVRVLREARDRGSQG
jgi:prevent-host-death family protein